MFENLNLVNNSQLHLSTTGLSLAGQLSGCLFGAVNLFIYG